MSLTKCCFHIFINVIKLTANTDLINFLISISVTVGIYELLFTFFLFLLYSELPAYQITTSSNARNSPYVEVNLVKDLAYSLVSGGSIDAFLSHLKEKVRKSLILILNKKTDFL